MPSADMFGFNLGTAELLSSPVNVSLLSPGMWTVADGTPGDFTIGDDFILTSNETINGNGILAVLSSSLTVNYTPSGGAPTLVVLDGVIVTTAGPGLQVSIVFLPDDPSDVPNDMLSIDTVLDNVSLAFGLATTFEICFAKGTGILTEYGERPIEDLSVGDRIQTMDNGFQKIRWIHSNTVYARGNVAPIKIAKGILGNSRDLLVSPQHRMLVSDWRVGMMFDQNEVLATAKSLINDGSIRQIFGGFVTYYHFMFDRHEIVYANGAPSESFLPGQLGMSSLEEDVQAEIYDLFPDLKTDLVTYGEPARMLLRNFEGHLISREFLN